MTKHKQLFFVLLAACLPGVAYAGPIDFIMRVGGDIIAFILALVCVLLINVLSVIAVFVSIVGKLMLNLAIGVGPIGVAIYPYMPQLGNNAFGFAMSGIGINLLSIPILYLCAEGLKAAVKVSQMGASQDGSPNLTLVIGVMCIVFFLIYLMFQLPSWAGQLFGGGAFEIPKGRMLGQAGKMAGAGAIAGGSAAFSAGKNVGGAALGRASSFIKEKMANRAGAGVGAGSGTSAAMPAMSSRSGGGGAPAPKALPSAGPAVYEGQFTRV